MADKKITQLQLRASVTDDLNIPSDDGIQSYRVTIAQIKAWILAAGNGVTAFLANGSVTDAKLATSAIQLVMPTASIMPFAGAAAPTGFLLCQGQAISRTTYATLFTALGGVGSPFGLGDGSTTFNVPDLRGIFIRGAGAQTIGAETYTGTLGTKQNDNLQSHSHTMPYGINPLGVAQNFDNTAPARVPRVSNNAVTATPTDAAGTGTETYPANIAMNYIIKT